MILCDNMIRQEIELGNIVIEPFNEEQLNPNSYDVRLGNDFYIVEYTNHDKPSFVGPYHFENGENIKVPVGGTLLGCTQEIAGSRGYIVPEIRAKSTTRRCGITICDDAGFGDIGYVNRWTVELTAHVRGDAPTLTVGQLFAQVVFFMSKRPDKPYQGQYNTNDWPQCMVPKKYRDKVRAPTFSKNWW